MFEIAKAVRVSECKICYGEIKKKKKRELRVKANLGSGNYPYCYHLDCFIKSHKETIEELIDYYSEKLNPSRKDNLEEI